MQSWHTTSHKVGKREASTDIPSPDQDVKSPALTPGRPSRNTRPKPHYPELGEEELRAGAGGQGAVTVPQTGAWAPSHIVFHPQGPGVREGRGRDAREGAGGPGGRVFRFMGSVETTTPINAFFQSLCLQVSGSLRIWGSGGQRVIGGASPASFLPSLLVDLELTHYTMM